MYTVYIQLNQGGAYAALYRQSQRRAHLRPNLLADQGRYRVRAGSRRRGAAQHPGAGKDLRISVITTKRAYDELEREGFIDTLPGKGCFVAERSAELLREEHLRKIEGCMQEIRRLAAACGLTEGELAEMWRVQKEETE